MSRRNDALFDFKDHLTAEPSPAMCHSVTVDTMELLLNEITVVDNKIAFVDQLINDIKSLENPPESEE